MVAAALSCQAQGAVAASLSSVVLPMPSRCHGGAIVVVAVVVVALSCQAQGAATVSWRCRRHHGSGGGWPMLSRWQRHHHRGSGDGGIVGVSPV